MTSPTFAVAATSPDVQGAAAAMLPRGNALDAVLAAVLAAGAVHRGVLLGPVQILVAGPGVGARAVDGRVRQPGAGGSRPRGFVPEETIPPAARAGAPCLFAAVAAALASFGSATLARVAAPAVELARSASAPRAKLLTAFSRRGPGVLQNDAFRDPLVAACGRLAGGTLVDADLVPRPEVTACAVERLDGYRVARAPWAEEAAPSDTTHVVVAADGRGMLAIACYEAGRAGFAIEELELEMPLVAQPVLRGQRRTPPGEPIPAACPIALCGPKSYEIALGFEASPRAAASLAKAALRLAAGDTLESAAAGERLRAVVRADASARRARAYTLG